MATTTANMSLVKWDTVSDYFSHAQLAANFQAIDTHDHTSGKGVQIPFGGLASLSVGSAELRDSAVIESKLASSAVTAGKIATSAVTTGKILDANVTDAKLATRFVRGHVASNGTITTGTGFTVARNATGDYTITYSTAFSTNPIGMATVGSLSAARITADVISTTTARFLTWNASGTATDLPFHFVVMSS